MKSPHSPWAWFLPLPIVGGMALLSLLIREPGNRIDISLHLPVVLALLFLWGPRVLPAAWAATTLLYLATGYGVLSAGLIAVAPTAAMALVYGLHRWFSRGKSLLSDSRSLMLWIAIALFFPLVLVYLAMAPFTAQLQLAGDPGSKLTFLNIIGVNIGLLSVATPLLLLLADGKALLHLRPGGTLAPVLSRPFFLPPPKGLAVGILTLVYLLCPAVFFLVPLAYAIPLAGFAMLMVAIRYGFGHTLLITGWAVLWNLLAGRILHPHQVLAETTYGDFTLTVIIWFVHVTGRTIVQLRDETAGRLASEERALQVALRHRALLQALPDIIFRVAEDGTFLEVHHNEQHELYTKPELFLNRKVAEVLPPPLGQELQDRVVKTCRGENQTIEYDLPLPDGPRWFEARLRPGSEGEAIIMVRDITELHVTRRSLTTSEARYRLLFDESPLGVVLLDGRGVVLSANRAAAKITGYPLDRIGNFHRDEISTDPQLMEIARTLRETQGFFAGEFPLRHASGRVITVYAHTYTVPIPGEDPQICVILEDIEGMKRLESQHQKDQELLAEAEGTNRMGVFRWEWTQPPLPDEQPAACFYSAGAARLLDIPEGEATTTDKDWLSVDLKVGDATRLSRTIRTALADGRGEIILRKMRPDGRHRHLAVSFWRPQGPANETHLNGLLRDITETQNLHESLEQYRTLFHLSTEPFLILNLEGQILEGNPAVTGLTGRPMQNLLQRPFMDLLQNPEEREQVDARLSEALHMGSFLSGLSVTLGVRGGGSRRMLLNLTPDMAGGRAYVVLTDIQELETARQLVVENQNRFQDLFSRLPAGFALHSMMFSPGGEALDYRFLLVNPHFERLTGLKAESVIGRTVRQVMPDTESSWIQTYGRVVTTGESITFTQYSQAVDKYFMVHAYRAREGQFATIFFDVTEQVRAEDARRLAEQRLTILMASLDAVVWEADAAGRFTYMSPAIERISGHPRDHWLDPLFHRTLIHPDDTGKWQAAYLVHAHDPEQRVVEYRIRHARGHFIWIRNHIRMALENGQVSGLRGVWVDVSDNHAAKSALEVRESRFLAVVASMSEGLVIQDETGLIVDCNVAAEQVLGLTRDQMAGRSSLDPRWRSIHEDGSPFPGTEHPAMVTLATGESQRDVIMGVHKPDGTLTWLLINSHLITDATHGVKQVVVTFRDITESRLAYQKLASESERRKRSLDRARELTEQISPRTLPLHPALDLQGIFVPSEDVGGDFVRIRLLPRDRLAVLMADYTGHGLEASMMAVLLGRDCESLMGDLGEHGDPARLMAELNHRVGLLDLEGHYPAMLAAILDLKTNTLTWCNAGFESPLLYRGKRPRVLPRSAGLYLGFDDQTPYGSERITLEVGDTLVLSSDALMELDPQTPAKPEALVPDLPGEGPWSAAAFLESLVTVYRTHRGSLPHDDLSAVVIRPVAPWQSDPLPVLDKESPVCHRFLERSLTMGWSMDECKVSMDTLCHQVETGPNPTGPFTMTADGMAMSLVSAAPPPADSPWLPHGSGAILTTQRPPPTLRRHLTPP